MSQSHFEPLRWRRHRGWATYAKLFTLLAVTAYFAHWFVTQA